MAKKDPSKLPYGGWGHCGLPHVHGPHIWNNGVKRYQCTGNPPKKS